MSEVGLQLKAEREKRGMSLQKAADELHLDAWVIEALESGDYQRIGATVYAKGHLKRYAGLLGLPIEPIIAAYEGRGAAPVEVTLTSQSARMAGAKDEQPMNNLSPGAMIGIAAGILLLVGLFWWRPWLQRGAAPTPQTASNPATAAPASAVVAQDEAPPAQEAPPPSQPKASTVMAREPAAATLSEANPVTLPGAGRAKLRLSFSADSWVDVHDANGKRAFAGNGLANSVKTISGPAPMRVYIGSANGVALEINDRAVAIGPQFFAGDVARFEVGADGVLRRDQSRGVPAASTQMRNARPRS